MKFNHSLFLYITGLILLVSYFFSTNLPSPPPAYFFWIITIFLACLIVWQIGKVDNTSRERLVLSEIFLLGFVLHLIFVIAVPYGLFGGDIHREYHNAEMILQYGWPIPEEVNLLAGSRINSLWPGIHLIGGISSNLLGIELFTIAKWIPTLVSLCVPLIIFILVKRMYGNSQASLLAAFGTCALYYNLAFHSGFVRETPSYVLLFVTLFFFMLYATERRRTITTISLLLLCLVSLLFSQHLTMFLLIVLLLIFIITAYSFRTVMVRVVRWPQMFKVSISRGLLIVVVLLASFSLYLIYIGRPVFDTLVLTPQGIVQETEVVPVEGVVPPETEVAPVEGVVPPETEVAPVEGVVPPETKVVSVWSIPGLTNKVASIVAIERTPRNQIITSLRIFFSGVFSILIVTWLFKNRETNIIWNVTGFLFAIFAVILTMLGLFVLSFPWGGVSRMESFAWAFVLIAATPAILNLKYKHLLKYAVAALVIFNLFMIPPYIYDHSAEPAYQANEFSMSYQLADYRAVEWFDGSGSVMGDVVMQEILSGLKQVPVYTDMDIYRGDLSHVESYDWLIFREENFKLVWLRSGYVGEASLTRLSPDAYDRYAKSSSLIKVYSNGDVNIYKVTQSINGN